MFVTDAGSVEGCFGELKGTPEDLDLPDGQTALFGPLELDGDFHEGVVLKVTDRQKLVVLENLPLADPGTEAGEDSPESAQEADASAIEAGLLAAGVAAGAAVAPGTPVAPGAAEQAWKSSKAALADNPKAIVPFMKSLRSMNLRFACSVN